MKEENGWQLGLKDVSKRLAVEMGSFKVKMCGFGRIPWIFSHFFICFHPDLFVCGRCLHTFCIYSLTKMFGSQKLHYLMPRASLLSNGSVQSYCPTIGWFNNPVCIIHFHHALCHFPPDSCNRLIEVIVVCLKTP